MYIGRYVVQITQLNVFLLWEISKYSNKKSHLVFGGHNYIVA